MPDLLERLLPPDRLRELSLALAVLDVAMSPEDEPEDRYFRFDPNDASGLALASMDNGSGDRYYIAFSVRRSVRLGIRAREPHEPLHAHTCLAVAWPPRWHAG